MFAEFPMMMLLLMMMMLMSPVLLPLHLSPAFLIS
jgi:hypothetical protein